MASSTLSRIKKIRDHISPSYSELKDGKIIKISSEVSEALSFGAPVVALESTIISHGMPYPQNLETAKQVEEIVRKNGAIPATIAILDGVPRIGLSPEELMSLAFLGRKARKTARRDIAHVVASNQTGNNRLCNYVFCIQGWHRNLCHRGYWRSSQEWRENFVTAMDISSDLVELGRTPVAVVSAGVKSILDISRTLEYLETQGACVAAYQTNEFPAFFTEKSGCNAPSRVDSPEECARLIDMNGKLGLGSGILIAVPIPSEHSASGNIIESAIKEALKDAREQKVTGSAETPFLLARVNELTGGNSLAANIALVKNNAQLAAQIAVSLSQLRKSYHN